MEGQSMEYANTPTLTVFHSKKIQQYVPIVSIPGEYRGRALFLSLDCFLERGS